MHVQSDNGVASTGTSPVGPDCDMAKSIHQPLQQSAFLILVAIADSRLS